MKKIRLFRLPLKATFLSLLFCCNPAEAADLMEVYSQAFISDQAFQQSISQQLANKQGVPISLSNILPYLGAVVTPNTSKTIRSGLNPLLGSSSQSGYTANLTLNQTVFNFSQFANLSQELSLSKQADAVINTAVQDLMLRVAKAYFNVLHAEDSLRYNEANKRAYAKQLDQITQQYKVGLKTITDVYTAQASYDSSLASYIGAETQLADQRENLRVITGIYYPNLSKLSDEFPLISPQPANIDSWVATAQRQNWAIKAAQYATDAACKNVKQQFGGHIPNVQLQGVYNVNLTRQVASPGDIGGGISTVIPVDGTSKVSQYGANLILNVPIVQGGYVVATTKQAQYTYKATYHNLEQQVRNVINQARQSYLGVLSGISQVNADKQAIKSGRSSLEGLQAGYQVGTQTLVDVLNQQQKLFQSYQLYAQDRYTYINDLLTLKSAAGTLSPADLQAINRWLVKSVEDYSYDEGSSFPVDNDANPSKKTSATIQTTTEKKDSTKLAPQ
jgi:outer membrane protein